MHRWGLGAPFCPFCESIPETEIHFLRDCAVATQIWQVLVHHDHKSRFFMEGLEDWVESNLTTKKGVDPNIHWVSLWATTCHRIRYWHNKAVHDPDFVKPLHQWQITVKLHLGYILARTVRDVGMARVRVQHQVQWTPPAPCWVCLNIDGSARTNSAGCGGLLRGDQGEWLGGFAKCLGMASAFEAELWGVLEGLKLAKAKGFR